MWRKPLGRVALLPVLVFFVVLSACAPSSLREETQPHAPEQRLVRSDDGQRAASHETPTPPLAGGPEEAVRSPAPMTLSDLRRKYPNDFVLNGPSRKRQVALSFDDGPDLTFTPRILDVLREHDVKATFFLIGNRVVAHPDVVKRMVREGHVVANHSWDHPNLAKLSPDKVRWQLVRAEEALSRVAGYRPKLFRPPYGSIQESGIRVARDLGYTVVNWNVDSLDWKGLSAEQVSTNVLSHVFPGSIILLHSAGGEGSNLEGTVRALPEIIRRLKADGVTFVTVPELLNIPYKK
ncbi:MAG TPA: polysaccharide deacetylase family protein [Calditerricola sp.]